jgi:prepilin-type N-terminal cleavage/methylation domain-containing protein
MLASPTRKAFTLIEMLLVLGIIALLAVIALPISLRVMESRNVAQGVTQLETALSQAKSRAMFDKRSHGIRFLRKSTDPKLVNGRPTNPDFFRIEQFEKVEDPGPFADGWVFNVDPQKQPHILNGAVQTGTLDFQGSVLPGDLLELNGGGQLYPVLAVRGPNVLELARPLAVTDLIFPQSIPSGARPSNYRIFRRPRPIPGEKPAILPANVVIDAQPIAATPNAPSRSLGMPPDLTILFSPSGRVIGSAAANDMICLWVQDTSDGNAENRALVVIYTRTGTIASYAIDEANAADPYSFARTGRGAGAGGL